MGAWIKLLGASLTLTLASLSFGQPVAPLSVGDNWTFTATFEREGRLELAEVTRSVAAVQDNLYVFEVVTRRDTSESRSRETRDRDLNLIESGSTRFSPRLDMMRLPLVVGQRAYSVLRQEIGSDRVRWMEGMVQTLPPGRVSTGAGEFNAYELATNGRNIDPRSGAATEYQARAWYAPEVGFFVKQEFFERNPNNTAFVARGRLDLKSYQRQSP